MLRVRQPTPYGVWMWVQPIPVRPDLRAWADLMAKRAEDDGLSLDHRAEWDVIEVFADMEEE